MKNSKLLFIIALYHCVLMLVGIAIGADVDGMERSCINMLIGAIVCRSIEQTKEGNQNASTK